MKKEELRKWLLYNAFKKDGNSINTLFLKTSKYYSSIVENTLFLIGEPSIGRMVYTLLDDRTGPYICATCNEPYEYSDKRPSPYCNHACAINEMHKARSTVWHSFIPTASRDLTLREWLLAYTFTKSGKGISPRVFEDPIGKIRLGELIKVTSFFPDTVTNSTRIYAFLNQQNELVKCAVCQKEVPPNNKNLQKPFCSGSCAGRFGPIRDKVRSTCETKYGGPAPANSVDIVNKMKATCKDRYGVDNYSKTIEGVYYMRQNTIGIDNMALLADRNTMSQLYTEKGSMSGLASYLGLSLTTISRHLKSLDIDITHDYRSSVEEKELIDYLHSLNVVIETNTRETIKPFELDIYIPSHKIAIEYDGVYWHTEQKGKSRQYHLNKTILCAKKGIQLLHIFSTDNMDIWQSIIKNKLGICDQKIGARQTEVRKITFKDASNFLQYNHMQGPSASSIRYGLFYKNELVCLMTFAKSRFSKVHDYELMRFCNKLNWVVVGGASKLLSFFRKAYIGASLVSYANKRWSNGHLYETLGFNLSHKAPPNYFYTKDCLKLYSRNKFQKHKLEEQLDCFDPCISEYQNMLNNKYDRIWDCGNLVYSMR